MHKCTNIRFFFVSVSYSNAMGGCDKYPFSLTNAIMMMMIFVALCICMHTAYRNQSELCNCIQYSYTLLSISTPINKCIEWKFLHRVQRNIKREPKTHNLKSNITFLFCTCDVCMLSIASAKQQIKTTK